MVGGVKLFPTGRVGNLDVSIGPVGGERAKKQQVFLSLFIVVAVIEVEIIS
jgi:hypothetical protein